MCNSIRKYNTRLYVVNEEQDLNEDYGFFYILDSDVTVSSTKPNFILINEPSPYEGHEETRLQVVADKNSVEVFYSLISEVVHWLFGSFKL